MKIVLGCVLTVGLLCTAGCSASSRGFDSVVAGVEQRYSIHSRQIPLMGVISLCARFKTHGGVSGLHIAEFDHIGKLDVAGLSELMQSELGAGWQPMVKDRNGTRSSLSVIFVEPSDKSMRMVIADYEHGELDLVGMEMNGARLAHWMHRPEADGIYAGRNQERTDRTD